MGEAGGAMVSGKGMVVRANPDQGKEGDRYSIFGVDIDACAP